MNWKRLAARQRRHVLAVGIAATIGATCGSFAPSAQAATVPLAADCLESADPVARADELMANVYALGSFPAVTLPANPAWNENPLGDANWEFRYHSVRYALDLLTTWRQSGTEAYRDRALFLLEDWHRDNPRSAPPSSMSWNDHSTARRAVVLACAADQVPAAPWLTEALRRHGTLLADPAFYRGESNHALNQNLGLLEVGRVLGRADWVSLAVSRLNALVLASVDSQGVTNEQSIGYQAYNYRRYQVAQRRLIELGIQPGSAFERIRRMPAFLAHATLPTGVYEMIGDTLDQRAMVVPGSAAQFAATLGQAGPKPTRTVAWFRAGYLFARTGWGDRRPIADETFLSLQWGPAPVYHGHPDGGSLTLAAYGSRLLVDPGLYAYQGGPMRTFMGSRQAHNVVTVDGLTWNRAASTTLLGSTETSRFVDARLRSAGYKGVTHTRRVTYSRLLDYVLVEDRLASSSVHTYRQLWHLVHDARPAIGVSSVITQRTRGNVLIRQLAGTPTHRIVKGATSPIQGWISYRYREAIAAPVAEARLRGSNVRFLTLVVPAAGRPRPEVSSLRLTSSGYSVVIRIGTRAERVTVSGTTVSVTPLG